MKPFVQIPVKNLGKTTIKEVLSMKEITRLQLNWDKDKITYFESTLEDVSSAFINFKCGRRIIFDNNGILYDQILNKHTLVNNLKEDILDAKEGFGKLYEITEEEYLSKLMLMELSK